MKKGKKSTSKHSSIFIRANDSKELSLIADIKIKTGAKAASQAFLLAASAYIRQLKEIQRLQSELSKVNNQLRESHSVLARLNNSHTLLGTYSKKFLSGKHIQSDLFED